MAWYIRIMGDVQGPFTNEQFKVQADRGRIDKATEVAQDPRGPWFPAADVPNLFSAPPPLPAGAATRRIAAPVNPATTDRGKRTSRAALASLAVGSVSYVLYAFLGGLGILVGMLGSVVAIVCGAIGLFRIAHSRRDSTGPSLAGGWMAISGVLVGTAAFAGGLMYAITPAQSARGSADRSVCMANLFSVAGGMQFAESIQGSLPAAIVDAKGRPLLSWRVAILPLIDEKPLYDEFHLDEPWDSEHNRALIPRMPAV